MATSGCWRSGCDRDPLMYDARCRGGSVDGALMLVPRSAKSSPAKQEAAAVPWQSQLRWYGDAG